MLTIQRICYSNQLAFSTCFLYQNENVKAIPKATIAIPKATNAIPKAIQSIPEATKAITKSTKAIP